MKNSVFIVTALILVISIFILFIQEVQPEDLTAAIIQKAFAATGADVVSSEIFVRGGLDAGNYASKYSREQLASDIIKGAGAVELHGAPDFNTIETDISEGTETDYIINDNRRIHISILRDAQAKENYYLSVSIVDMSGRPDVAGLIAGMTDLLDKYGIEPEVNISLTGSLEGMLGESEIERLYGRVFDSIDANMVEGMSDDGLISVSAFSPSIKDAIRVNGKRVNVNLAARYNSYEGKTYIWLATPVITTEY